MADLMALIAAGVRLRWLVTAADILIAGLSLTALWLVIFR
jgi:hypothetical protein